MPMKHIPQDLFETGAAILAKAHLRVGTDLATLSQQLYQEYRHLYLDDGFRADWQAAAEKAIEFCGKVGFEGGQAVSVLHHFRHYAMKYDRTGRKKPLFKRLGGTWFHYENAKNPNRIEDFVQRFGAYCLMAKSGLLKPEWLAGPE